MNNTRIALQLLRHGIITDGDEMKSNPLLFAIKIGSKGISRRAHDEASASCCCIYE